MKLLTALVVAPLLLALGAEAQRYPYVSGQGYNPNRPAPFQAPFQPPIVGRVEIPRPGLRPVKSLRYKGGIVRPRDRVPTRIGYDTPEPGLQPMYVGSTIGRRRF